MSHVPRCKTIQCSDTYDKDINLKSPCSWISGWLKTWITQLPTARACQVHVFVVFSIWKTSETLTVLGRSLNLVSAHHLGQQAKHKPVTQPSVAAVLTYPHTGIWSKSVSGFPITWLYSGEVQSLFKLKCPHLLRERNLELPCVRSF